MTKRDIQELFTHWQGCLGLQTWTIDVRIEEFDEPDFMATLHSAQYEEAIIKVQPWLTTGKRPPRDDMVPVDITPTLVERFVVHELIHLALVRYDFMMDDHVYGGLSATDRDHIAEAFHRAKETTVDKLAVALVRAFGET